LRPSTVIGYNPKTDYQCELKTCKFLGGVKGASSMKCIFVDIEQCEFEFFLSEDEVDDKMKKKFKKLGFPNIWIHYPSDASDALADLGSGIFQQGDFQCSSFSIIEPTADSSFEINYNEERNSISLKLEGTFFSGNDSEVHEDDGETEFMLSQSTGIIQVITLNNDKGKPIKKPKDEWGMSDPIEALAADLDYNGKGYGLRFSLETKAGVYQDGKIIND